jgi:hypothetical protein
MCRAIRSRFWVYKSRLLYLRTIWTIRSHLRTPRRKINYAYQAQAPTPVKGPTGVKHYEPSLTSDSDMIGRSLHFIPTCNRSNDHTWRTNERMGGLSIRYQGVQKMPAHRWPIRICEAGRPLTTLMEVLISYSTQVTQYARDKYFSQIFETIRRHIFLFPYYYWSVMHM